MGANDINEIIARVAAKKAEWASLAPGRKLEILDSLLDNLDANFEELQNASIVKRDGEGGAGSSYASLDEKDRNALQNASRASHYLHSAMVCRNRTCAICSVDVVISE